MIAEREQVVQQIEQLEDIKESNMIDIVVADNEAGNAGVVATSLPITAGASMATGHATASGGPAAAHAESIELGESAQMAQSTNVSEMAASHSSAPGVKAAAGGQAAYSAEYLAQFDLGALQ